MYLNRNIWMVCMAVFTTIAFSACAQTKKSSAKKKITAKQTDKLVLLQATRQKTNPGREEGEPLVEYRFVVVWKSTKEPAAFYWKGEQSWQSCDITRIKHFKPLVINDNGMPQDINYENNDPGNITYQKGDTLELYPVITGKHPIPAEIPKDKINIIYYKEVNGKWQALPVEKITKLPTIAMP